MNIVKSKPLSVVVVTFNSSNSISKLLYSLEKEANLISEVLFIDNNSDDKVITEKLINNFKKKYSLKFRYIQNKENIGFGRACNIAVKKVKTKYVLFINPDTYFKKNSIRVLLNHAIRCNADLIGGVCARPSGIYHRTIVKKLDIIGGIFELTNIGKILKTKIGTDSFYYDISEYNKTNDFNVGALSGAYLIVNIHSFTKLGGFDEDYFMYLEDVDLGYKANLAGMKVMFCPHSRVTHIGGESSNNKHNINYKAWSMSRKSYFLKNSSIFTNIIIQPIFILEDIILKVKSLINR